MKSKNITGMLKPNSSVWMIAFGLLFSLQVGQIKADSGSIFNFTKVFLPETSDLRDSLNIETPADKIQQEILKKIPIGSKEDKVLEFFANHMPKKQVEKHNLRTLPKRLKGKPYKGFRIFHQDSLRHLGSKWVEVLFFFHEGVLIDVFVGSGSTP